MQFSILFFGSLFISAIKAQGVEAGTLLPEQKGTGLDTVPYSFAIYINHIDRLNGAGEFKPQAHNAMHLRAAVCDDLVNQFRLSNGILTDDAGRIGGIVANRQYQFDGPPSQTGTIYNGGWNIMSEGSNSWLALGDNSTFWSCASGSFSNLYDAKIGEQCLPAEMDIVICQ